jgi:prepilin-type N-terminal cleavage/methylation domain-containing protein/prepilin-type processing-associated H-X9-DG protein
MRSTPINQPKAFTLLELVVVVAISVIVLLTLLPAVTRTNPAASAFQCMNNNRQLTVAWRMFAEDNRGQLVYSGDDSLTGFGWTHSIMDYSGDANNWDTNVDIVKGPLFPYTGRNPAIYKCPSDRSIVFVNGFNRPRVRSMEMNFYLAFGGGKTSGFPFMANCFVYTNLAEITAGGPHSPGPAKLWVFTDMREDFINWGDFQVDMRGYSPNSPAVYRFVEDMPAFYHNGGGSFAFADGHGEIHKWTDPRTVPGLGTFDSSGGPPSEFASPRNADIAWLQDHSTRPK